MKLYKIFILFIIIFSFSFSNMKVDFINPGLKDEGFWNRAVNFMTAVAEDFDIDLHIHYAERSFKKTVTLAQEILFSDSPPDYLLIVNEKLIAPEVMLMAEKTNVKVVVFSNILTKTQELKYGKPREKLENYIFSFAVKHEDAGRIIAEETAKEAKKVYKDLKFIAINGNRATTAGAERGIGLRNFILYDEDSVLLQETFAEWRTDLAFDMTKGLVRKFPDFNAIWVANDSMGIGVLSAIEKFYHGNKKIFIGVGNWSDDMLNAISNGTIVGSVGGHFMLGGWILVLLHDYENGIEISNDNNYKLTLDLFHFINDKNVDYYRSFISENKWSEIDFKKFSKFENKDIEEYDFSFEKIEDQFEKD